MFVKIYYVSQQNRKNNIIRGGDMMKKAIKSMHGGMWIFLALIILLTGCSSDSDTVQKSNTEKGSQKVNEKIVYYGFTNWAGSSEYAEGYKELAEEFANQNPGYELEIQHDPWDTWLTKLPTMLASGNAPDVFLVNNPDLPTFANGGFTMDLSDLGEDYFNNYFPGVLSMYKQKSKNMAIPFTTDTRVLWYNKEIFEAAGLDPNQPPRTWEEFAEYARKTSEVTIDGEKVYGYAMDLGLKEFPVQSLFLASNTTIIDSETLKATVDTNEFREYLELLVKMKPYYEPDFNALNHIQAGTLFAQGKAAMTIAGFWPWMNEGFEEQDFYAHAMIPKMNENAPEGSFGGGFGIAVSNDTDNIEAAINLAKLMCSPEFNSKLMSDVPASEDGIEASPFGQDPKYDVFMQQIPYARQAQPVKTIHYAEIDMAVWETVSKVINEEISIDEGIIELENVINKIVQK